MDAARAVRLWALTIGALALSAVCALGVPRGFAASRTVLGPTCAFSDVCGYPDAAAITFLASQGIVVGYGGIGGPFRPAASINRAEFAQILDLEAGLDPSAAQSTQSSPFVDVPALRWYTGFVNVAAAAPRCLLPGRFGTDRFGPFDPVTLSDVVAAFEKLLDLYPAPACGPAAATMAEAQSVGLLRGLGVQSYTPDMLADRGQVAQLAYNAYVTVPDAAASHDAPLLFSAPWPSGVRACVAVLGPTDASGALTLRPLPAIAPFGTLCTLPGSGERRVPLSADVWLTESSGLASLRGRAVLVVTDGSGAVDFVGRDPFAAAPASERSAVS